MARKNYSEEFRRQPVDLHESTPGATVRGIAEDLGIVRGTLRHWLEAYGTGKKTAPDGTLTSSPLQSKSPSYYAWKAGAPARAERAAADAVLIGRIRVIHEADNTVGAPRVTAELNDGTPAEERVNHKRVARVMRVAKIAGYVNVQPPDRP